MAYENELRDKYIETQLIQKQIREIQEQVQAIEEQILELTYMIESLNDLHSLEKGHEILVPVHNGIFIKAEIKDAEGLIVNVGKSTMVKKSIESTQEMLKGQYSDLESYREKLVKGFNTLVGMSEKIQDDTKELLKKYEENV